MSTGGSWDPSKYSAAKKRSLNTLSLEKLSLSIDQILSVEFGMTRDGLSSGTRDSSASRRQSVCCGVSQSETPKSDRRAMLEAWRQARAGAIDGVEPKKRNRMQEPLFLLPNSNLNTPSTKDFARRKQQKIEIQENATLSQPTGESLLVKCSDNENANEVVSLMSARTPLGRRPKGLGSARRKTFLGKPVLQVSEGKNDTNCRIKRRLYFLTIRFPIFAETR